MNIWESIRRANAPKPPEGSVRLRLACWSAVVVALLAAESEAEISLAATVVSIALFSAGMVFSHRTRTRSLAWVKATVALGATSSLVWFVERIGGGPIGAITSVENPLTVLFAWILVVHSFHVPARRDLVFALGGAAALMAVAAAQAFEMGFAFYVVGWLAVSLWALFELGASAADGRRPAGRGAVVTVGAVVAAALVAFLTLPAPTVAVRVDFQENPGRAGAVPSAGGALAGDSGQPLQLSRPGSPAGAARVGGYLGFAGSLDTALRGQLGQTLVMQVRAERPGYWVGETFDQWTGENWNSTAGSSTALTGGSPFYLPAAADEPVFVSSGNVDLQTFYVESATADLVFHEDAAAEVWMPSSRLYYDRAGTVVSPIGLGKGAIYTVRSDVTRAAPDQLRSADSLAGLADGGATSRDPGFVSRYTQLPQPYARVHQLAESITRGIPDEYDQIEALISWIGANTKYSTDIPPLASGQNTVDEFLFGNRVGFCEQISTSLAVMLRGLGIPTREAVGYVPGSYNPITDLYQVRAEDAHAWVEAYFPGFGWQSFDPTASVPLASPSPGATALADTGHVLARVPWIPAGGGAVGLAAVSGGAGLYVRRRRLARRTPAEVLAARMETAGRKQGRPRRPSETIVEYARALDEDARDGHWGRLAAAIDAAAYGGVAISSEAWRSRPVRGPATVGSSGSGGAPARSPGPPA